MNAVSKKLMKVIFIAAVVTQFSPTVAYPPDNAAVLYYKAFMLYESPDNIGTMLWDYWKGKIPSNEKIVAPSLVSAMDTVLTTPVKGTKTVRMRKSRLANFMTFLPVRILHRRGGGQRGQVHLLPSQPG